jgi:outer membrane lipoprotein-sorting protein
MLWPVCCAAKHESKSKTREPDIVKILPEKDSPDNEKLEAVLKKLNDATDKLTSLEAKIEYLFIQDPEMLDSRTLQKGDIYYAKDKSGSRLRVNFKIRQQDDDKQHPYREEFIFDGVWLTRIDYKLEKIDYYQQAPADRPLDVFEFISHNFPMVGFTDTKKLDEDFNIELIDDKSASSKDLTQLHLVVKKGSIYEKDYKDIDFWVSNKSFLPVRMIAESTEGDIHDTHFLDIKVNKNLKNSVFNVETPNHFSENRVSLEKD